MPLAAAFNQIDTPTAEPPTTTNGKGSAPVCAPSTSSVNRTNHPWSGGHIPTGLSATIGAMPQWRADEKSNQRVPGVLSSLATETNRRVSAEIASA